MNFFTRIIIPPFLFSIPRTCLYSFILFFKRLKKKKHKWAIETYGQPDQKTKNNKVNANEILTNYFIFLFLIFIFYFFYTHTIIPYIHELATTLMPDPLLELSKFFTNWTYITNLIHVNNLTLSPLKQDYSVIFNKVNLFIYFSSPK